MSRMMVRVVTTILVLSALALPLAAQPEPGRVPYLSLLAEFWHRLAAPVVALFSASETDGRSGWDPDGLTTDGRGGFDPNGSNSDGRSGFDPNG